jgi:hypothetical protein
MSGSKQNWNETEKERDESPGAAGKGEAKSNIMVASCPYGREGMKAVRSVHKRVESDRDTRECRKLCR